MISVVNNGAIADTEAEMYNDLSIYPNSCIIFCIDTKRAYKFETGAISSLNNAVETLEKKVQVTFGEILTGVVDGANATFTTAHNFTPEKVKVYVNGIVQRIIQDYQLIGNNTVQFTFSPEAGETLTIDY